MFKNEPTLYERLMGLFQEVNFIYNLSKRKRKSYAYKVVETRNYLTHFDHSKKEKILKSDEMFYSTKYFEMILNFLILKEFGLEKEFIEKKILEKQFLIDIIKNSLNFESKT
mgnify:CR=1 FL=1